MAEKFPEKIYVKREYDEDESYLLCSEKPSDISEQEDTIKVGVYELTQVTNLVNKTVIEEK